MKVCFFHLKAHAIFENESKAPIGGTLVQLKIIAEKLAEDSKNEVFFLVGNFGQPKHEVHGSFQIFSSTLMERTVGNIFLAPWRLWQDFRSINADVYVTSSAGPEIGLLSLYCSLRRKRMIYRVAHEWDCSGEYRSTHRLLGRIFEWGLKRADVVVAQSEDQALLLRKNYSIKAIVIKNSCAVLNRKSDELLPKKGVLWVARCEYWKHPEIFLTLAAFFPKESFTMICPKQKYQEAFFENIKKEAHSLENMIFVDFVPFDNIQEYFDQAKVFVGTSDYEGFPNTYIQACVGGTPIVSYKVDPDRFINTYGAGYVANGDIDQLRKMLMDLLHNKEKWREASEKSQQYVKEHHDINSTISKWQEILMMD